MHSKEDVPEFPLNEEDVPEFLDYSNELRPGGLEVEVLGMGYPLYAQLFPAHVAADDAQLRNTTEKTASGRPTGDIWCSERWIPITASIVPDYRMAGDIGMGVTSKRELASILNGRHCRDSDKLGQHLSEYEL